MDKGNSPLMNQLEKVFRHTRANSYGTRARYKGSCKNFISFLETEFKMKNLNNLQDKHIVSYIHYRQEQGIAPKTLKNDLGAIRYLHDMLPNAKYSLSDNQTIQKLFDVKLKSTPAIKGNRAWTEEEFHSMKEHLWHLAASGKRNALDLHDILVLCRAMGLRITEATAMRKGQASQGIRTGVYQVQGEAKNGKWRKVPLSDVAREVMIRRVATTQVSDRLFIPPHEKTHETVLRFENALAASRDRFVTSEGETLRTWHNGDEKVTNRLTFHGLRYCYVQQRMVDEMNRGYSWEVAARKITVEVGHNRTDVLKVYLAGTDFYHQNNRRS